jgi:hypothetical protein
VAVACKEEDLRKFFSGPPPRPGPHAELVLDDHSRRVLTLWVDLRETVGWAAVRHGGRTRGRSEGREGGVLGCERRGRGVPLI